jgi:hypothetical protein
MTDRNYAILLLQELHEAMADVMMLRRLSDTSKQRAKAEAAITVWRKVEEFLASRSLAA